MTRTIAELEARLKEAEELLHAIRSGAIDAFVVSGPHGDRVCTLTGADHPYRILVEAMREGAVILAPDRTIAYSNDDFAAIVGLPRDQVTGAVMDRHVAPEDLAFYGELLEKAAYGDASGDLGLVSASSGATVPVHMSIGSFGSGERGSLCAVITDLTEHEAHQKLIAAEAVERAKRAEAEEANRRISGILGTITDSYFELDWSWRITEINVRAAEDLGKTRDDVSQQKRDELARQELARRLVDAQESERRRIAIEMHDQFGQQLSALALKLAALRATHHGQTILTEQLALLEAMAKRLDVDLDQFVWRLHPPSLDDLGLVEALDNYVHRWAAGYGLHAEVQTSGIDRGDLTSEIATALYRITQEALNNVAKHAHASSAVVLIDRSAARVSLIIEDDGKGFDVAHQLRSRERFGLRGMRERALLLGGEFDIESAPGKGTTIVVRIPLPPGGDEAGT
jgi:PAS domain S-box-containing protein